MGSGHESDAPGFLGADLDVGEVRRRHDEDRALLVEQLHEGSAALECLRHRADDLLGGLRRFEVELTGRVEDADADVHEARIAAVTVVGAAG